MWRSGCPLLMCVALGAGPLLVGCTSGTPTRSNPGVAQVGETIMRTVGADMEATLGYKFADSSLGDEWLVVDLALTGLSAESVEVRQEAISVITPDGRRIPLPTQKEFIAAYPETQSLLRRAEIALAQNGDARGKLLRFQKVDEGHHVVHGNAIEIGELQQINVWHVISRRPG